MSREICTEHNTYLQYILHIPSTYAPQSCIRKDHILRGLCCRGGDAIEEEVVVGEEEGDVLEEKEKSRPVLIAGHCHLREVFLRPMKS